MSGQIPLLHYVAAAAAGLPLLAAILRWSWRGAGFWFLVASLVSLLGDGLGLYLSTRGSNNQWLAYFISPVFFAAILLGLADRQLTEVERVAARIATGLLVGALLIVALVAEDLTNFSQFAIPLGSLVVLGAAAWTLVRAGLGTGSRTDVSMGGLWEPAGFALYGAVTAAYLPLVSVFSRSDLGFVDAVLRVKSVAVIMAFVLIGWGVYWQPRATSSGRSSWWSSLPSGSS